MVEVGYIIIRWLHDLFTIIWLGGMITLGLIVLPSIKQTTEPSQQRARILKEIQKRLSTWTYVSMGMLVLTGLLLMQRSVGINKLLHFSTTETLLLSLKHIILLVMLIISLTRSLVLPKKKKQTQEKYSVILLFTNLVLAIVVLFLSAFSTALSLL